ncbi:MAG: OmpA family protein [Kofleriaceae bacterium]|nr:OmpA family protein [Kofleriaceae bacterium]
MAGTLAPMTGLRVASGSSLPMGLGLSYSLVPQSFDLVAEAIGQFAPNAENYQPLEVLTGVKLYLAENSFLSLGVGAGLLPSRGGNPDFRSYLGIVFEPGIGDRDRDGLKDDVDQCPDEPEDYDDFEDSDGCPDLDNDVDGILDVDDDCPLTPEDRDGDEDEDGCPEDGDNDRDGDGIIDFQDSCPDEPEDIDGFEDSNGCPDEDNDVDGILDIDDLCPDSPEDYDTFEDGDGCPEADNDNDRILDEDDECPRVDGESAEETSETYNTIDDEDGCPDNGPVTKVDGVILVLEKIHFETDSDVIKEESFPILHAVAMTIDTNPDIKLVEVQGHTDERGSAEYNRELSQRRADSVVRFLVKDGVAKSRLQARGYGEDEPKNRKHSKAAWTENRRVEFLIRD